MVSPVAAPCCSMKRWNSCTLNICTTITITNSSSSSRRGGVHVLDKGQQQAATHSSHHTSVITNGHRGPWPATPSGPLGLRQQDLTWPATINEGSFVPGWHYKQQKHYAAHSSSTMAAGAAAAKPTSSCRRLKNPMLTRGGVCSWPARKGHCPPPWLPSGWDACRSAALVTTGNAQARTGTHMDVTMSRKCLNLQL